MVWALSEGALHNVIDYFLDRPPVTDDDTAQTLARLIHVIPGSVRRESDRRRAADRSRDDAAYLREAFLAVAAPAVVESREQVLQRARAGELIIFEAIDDVRTLPSEAVGALGDRLCGVVDVLIEAVARGAYSFGGLDPGHALTLLSVWHPSSGPWDRNERSPRSATRTPRSARRARRRSFHAGFRSRPRSRCSHPIRARTIVGENVRRPIAVCGGRGAPSRFVPADAGGSGASWLVRSSR